MKIIKRDGSIVDYNPDKIRVAIKKANNEVSRKEKAIGTELSSDCKWIPELLQRTRKYPEYTCKIKKKT